MGVTFSVSPDQPDYDLLYDKEYYSKWINVDHFVDKQLSFREIHNGYLIPHKINSNEGGIFDSEGSYVKGSSYIEGVHHTFRKSLKESSVDLSQTTAERGISISDAEHKHSTVVFIGALIKVWGHFITDSMRLLWFLRSMEYRENFADCELVYFPASGFQLKGDWLRMFEILGINTSLVTPVTELTRYDRIILPDESFFMTSDGTRYFTSEYVDTINIVRDFAIAHSHPAHGKKIYFSHAKYRGTGIPYGEERLEKYFASKGYEIIPEPGDLGLDEELNALVNCESFASTVGSCSHNMVFCRDNTEIILIPRANYLTGYQVAIDQVHTQNIHYIDSSFSFFASTDPWSGPFLYFISSNLRKYFHDPDTDSIIYPSDFWKYLRSAFGFRFSSKFGRIVDGNNPKAYMYYSTVAAEYFGKIIKMSWPYRLREWIKRVILRKKPTQ